MLGLPEHFVGDLMAICSIGFLASMLLTVGTLLFDYAYRRVDFQEEIKKGNVAAAITLASVVLGIAFVMGMTVKAVIG